MAAPEAGQCGTRRAARAAANRFARAWSARTLEGPPGTSYSRDVRSAGRAVVELGDRVGTDAVAVTVASVNRSGDTDRAVLDVRWSLPGGATWAYSEPVPL